MIAKLTSLLYRVLFVGAFALAAVAVLEELSNQFGYTLTIAGGFSAGRLLEISAVAVLFVIALELRQLKQSAATSVGTESVTDG